MTRAHKHRNLPKLWDFIKLQVKVEQALFQRKRPETDCVTANSYDFRTNNTGVSVLSKALSYLGVHNTQMFNATTFARGELVTIRRLWLEDNPTGSEISHEKMARYVIGFQNYDKLKRGSITKWVKLPMYGE